MIDCNCFKNKFWDENCPNKIHAMFGANKTKFAELGIEEGLGNQSIRGFRTDDYIDEVKDILRETSNGPIEKY